MIDQVTELYEQFVALPAMVQWAAGIGTLASIAAATTIWKWLYPVRWAVSKLLDGSSRVLNPGPHRPKAGRAEKPNPHFDLSSPEAILATLEFYNPPKIAKRERRVRSLSDPEIKKLADIITELRGPYCISHSGIRHEHTRREDAARDRAQLENLADRERLYPS